MSIYKGDVLISGNVNCVNIPSSNIYEETIKINDDNNKHVYSEYSKKNGLNDTRKIFRFFTPNGDKWADLAVAVTENMSVMSFGSTYLDTSISVNGKLLANVEQIPTKVSEINNDSGFSIIKKEEISGTISNYGLLSIGNWYTTKELISVTKSSDTSYSDIIRAIPVLRTNSDALYIQCFNWQTGEFLPSGTEVKLSVLYIDK